MARRISGPTRDAETREWARRIAEAQVELNRVRNSRRQLITRLLVDPGFRPAQVYRQRLRLANWFWAVSVPACCLSMLMRLGHAFFASLLKVKKSSRSS